MADPFDEHISFNSLRSLLIQINERDPSPLSSKALAELSVLEKRVQEKMTPGFNDVLLFVANLAAMQFRGRLPISGDGSDADALAAALNMLAEELQHSVVSKRELEEQKLFLETIIDAIPGIIFVKDIQGKYITCNEGFAKAMGIKKQFILGKTIADFFSGEAEKSMEQHDQAVLSSQKTLLFEELIPTKKGLRWHLVALFPLKDIAGNVYAIGGSIKDVHEIQQLRQDLDHERTRLNQIIETAPAILYTRRFGTEGAISFIAPNVSSLGYSPSDFIKNGSFWTTRVHPEDLERVLQGIQNVSTGGRSLLEYRFRKNDGSYVWLRDEYVSIGGGDKAPKEMIGFLIDINDEMAWREKYEGLFHAIEGVANIAFTDPSGQITFFSEREIRGEARSSVNLSRLSLDDLFHPEQQTLVSVMWESLTQGLPWSGEIWNLQKDGTLSWFNMIVAPFRNKFGKNTGYIVVQFDITNEKLMQQKMVHSSKMASLGEMAGSIAHEINNPLAIIQGKVDQLRIKLRKDVSLLSEGCVEFDRHLVKIEDTIGRIAAIIKGLRSFSRNADRDPFSETTLGQIVNDTLELCRERFRNHGVEIKVQVDSEVKFKCRPVQISQVLMNLLGNAHDAIEKLPDKWIELTAFRLGDRIFINVMDSGRGIPEKVAGKMMTPFFSTKEVGKGTGLGLSISKGIIEDHHGQFRYDPSSPNTKFIIELPLIQPEGVEIDKHGEDN